MRRKDPELHERRRGELLAAAERCFVARGFHRTTIQDIARAADVSQGLLYRYFPDKRAVIVAAAARDNDRLLARIAALRDATDFAAALRPALRVILREAMAPDYVRLATEVLAEACRDPELAAAFAVGERAVREAWIELLSERRRRGEVAADLDLAAFVDAMTSLIDGLGVRVLLQDSVGTKAIEAMLQRFVQMLLLPTGKVRGHGRR
jgi:TetR/AcrR family transcriptional regulator, repressor for uid operon